MSEQMYFRVKETNSAVSQCTADVVYNFTSRTKLNSLIAAAAFDVGQLNSSPGEENTGAQRCVLFAERKPPPRPAHQCWVQGGKDTKL